MTRKKLDFTLEEVQEEVANICNWLNDEILEVFGHNFYMACLNQPLFSFKDNDDTRCRDLTVDDFKDCPITHDIECAFDYAKGYRFGDINIPDNFLDGMGCFYSFAESLFNHIEDSKYRFLYELTKARATLDNDDYLSLKELALLAGVDERTVRNAASSKDTNGLKTQKSGSSTIVENDEARRWLANRPDFKPTEYIDDTTLNTPRYFEDEAGFGRFLSYRREELGLNIKDVADAVGITPDVISDLENGIDRIHLNQLNKLADVLKENSARFIKDYMRIFHIEALADLHGYEYKSIDNSEQSEKFKNFKLMLFKQQMKLESQLETVEHQ